MSKSKSPGKVLWHTGSKDEAKAVCEKARDTFTDNEKLEETIKQFMP